MKLLAIGAHLDDIELACGGTLAKAVQQSHAVKMIVLTNSAYQDYKGNMLRTKEQALDEGEKAAAILGVTDLDVLDFPTKDLPYSSQTVEALDSLITTYQPDMIFTHWPSDTHQDHRNTAMATLSAARRCNTIFMYEPIYPSGRSYVPFFPQAYVDIGLTLDVKLRSLVAHQSQYQKYGEQWVQAVKARATLRGYEMQRTYAEAFQVIRLEVGI